MALYKGKKKTNFKIEALKEKGKRRLHWVSKPIGSELNRGVHWEHCSVPLKSSHTDNTKDKRFNHIYHILNAYENSHNKLHSWSSFDI